MDNVKGLRILKIGDFGISKVDMTAFAKQTSTGLQGGTTPAYKSPEVIKGKVPTEKADVWAAGIILYRLCYFNHPFEPENKD